MKKEKVKNSDIAFAIFAIILTLVLVVGVYLAYYYFLLRFGCWVLSCD